MTAILGPGGGDESVGNRCFAAPVAWTSWSVVVSNGGARELNFDDGARLGSLGRAAARTLTRRWRFSPG